MIRDSETLRRDQAEILATCREARGQRGAVAVLPRPGGAIAAGVYGRVSATVSSDPTHGPHLMVVRQVWRGTPPMAVDGDGPAVRCYPSPNRELGDYAVNEIVRVVAARGAMVAEVLA